MLIVALALVAVLAVTVVSSAQVLRSQQRAHARREDLLVNQLLHAAGMTWQPAPAAAVRRQEPEHPGYIASPEQLPT